MYDNLILSEEERRIVAYIDSRLALPDEQQESEYDENIKPLKARRKEILDRARTKEAVSA